MCRDEKIRNLSDAPTALRPHSYIPRWVGTLGHSRDAERLDRRDARRVEVRIDRYAREDIETGYHAVQHKEIQSDLENML